MQTKQNTTDSCYESSDDAVLKGVAEIEHNVFDGGPLLHRLMREKEDILFSR